VEGRCGACGGEEGRRGGRKARTMAISLSPTMTSEMRAKTMEERTVSPCRSSTSAYEMMSSESKSSSFST
jgi:hypothetical protein